MRRGYKHSLDRIITTNRWRQSRIQRSGDWVIVGIQRWWFNPLEYEYRICFFGFDIRIWMKRKFIEK